MKKAIPPGSRYPDLSADPTTKLILAQKRTIMYGPVSSRRCCRMQFGRVQPFGKAKPENIMNYFTLEEGLEAWSVLGRPSTPLEDGRGRRSNAPWRSGLGRAEGIRRGVARGVRRCRFAVRIELVQEPPPDLEVRVEVLATEVAAIRVRCVRHALRPRVYRIP